MPNVMHANGYSAKHTNYSEGSHNRHVRRQYRKRKSLLFALNITEAMLSRVICVHTVLAMSGGMGSGLNRAPVCSLIQATR